MKKFHLLFLLFGFICGTTAQTEFGTASFYGLEFHGKPTASGHIYSQNELTAAHKTLPLGTIVKVTNTKNNKSVFVKINDRGPFVKGRVIDLSTKAADILGYRNKGTAYVKIEVVKPEPIDASEMTVSLKPVLTSNKRNNLDCLPADESWKDVPTIKDKDEPSEDAGPRQATSGLPVNNTPQPATEIKAANTCGLINRSPYVIMTNSDKSKSGFYGVQIGVFSDPSVIFEMMDELEKFKQSVLIQQENNDGKIIYKVYMGKFQNRAYADALKLVLSDKYTEASVLKYD